MASTLLALVLTFFSLSSAQHYKKHDGIVVLPLTATRASNISSNYNKRQIVSPLDNIQTGTRYMVDFSIGTPPQSVSLAIDTGSSETWVDPECPTSGQTTLCESFPNYNSSSSTSAVDLGYNNVLDYGQGEADIEYYTDDFLLGGAIVSAQQFGIAYASNYVPTGMIGVGPGIELIGYPAIIDSLAAQGIINSRAFSLDLRGVDSPTGAIIFGGIDIMKYIGLLEKCPIIPASESPDGFDRYWIYMNSVGITKPGDTASKTYPSSSTNPEGQAVFLDSGGTISRLPTSLFNAIVADFPGATEDGNSGLYLVDCSVASQAGTMDFGFGNTIIHVLYQDFIWQIEGTCYIGLAADDETPALGDSFLRAAFVVYDQDNQNLLLANAADCGTNLVAITSGPDAVPSIVGACGAASSSSSSVSPSSTLGSSLSSSTLSSVTTVSSSLLVSNTLSSVPSVSPSPSSVLSSTSSSPTSSTNSLSSASSSASSVLSSTSNAPTSTMSAPISHSDTSSLSATSISTSTIVLLPSSVSITGNLSSFSVSSTTSTFVPYPIRNTTTNLGPTSTQPSPLSSTHLSNSDLTEYSTSTIFATTIYTITSCAPTVTDCPLRIGKVTTDIISVTTTLCLVAPVTPSPLPIGYTVSTLYETLIYTITSCAATVTDCPDRMGKVTTEMVSLYTAIWPVTPVKATATETQYYTMAECTPGVDNCPYEGILSQPIGFSTVEPVVTVAMDKGILSHPIGFSTVEPVVTVAVSSVEGVPTYPASNPGNVSITALTTTSPTTPSVSELANEARREAFGWEIIVIVGFGIILAL